ncbi:subtilisin inhibitor-like [Kineococcus xinjiangensis]|uniref:Subtilisin inhibitor-like n=1 Tax=Kineococcus xinjiangensis TaxID=512762 RepID=A0A2S6IDS4_9ACTN|nr:SSI family serine proteinase inhibitor [Kineococcus xinjiangensis]PPK92361.1 subtilisin inhibitor-like [Kineococcus xinjiangensis]
MLTITVTDGAGTSTTWTLTCPADGEPGGDHPDPAGACAALDAAKDPFAPVPKDLMCTQVFGGPETATVRGRWRDSDVAATFKRTDGCEIARWNRLAPLLQPGTAASGGSGAT